MHLFVPSRVPKAQELVGTLTNCPALVEGHATGKSEMLLQSSLLKTCTNDVTVNRNKAKQHSKKSRDLKSGQHFQFQWSHRVDISQFHRAKTCDRKQNNFTPRSHGLLCLFIVLLVVNYQEFCSDRQANSYKSTMIWQA